MSNFDPEKFLNQTFYSWHTATMLGGVINFLEWCESNLVWQRRCALQKAQQEGAEVEFDPPDQHLAASYGEQLIENAEYRFDVSLSQRVRYAGLVAFVTTLEWCAMEFRRRLAQDVPDAPCGENKHVHLFSSLNGLSSSAFDTHIDDLRRLVHVRNCVVHAAGFIDDYEFKNEIRHSVKSLNGIRIWNENFLGISICIEEHAIERYAKAASAWVPKLDERCTTAGMFTRVTCREHR